MFHRGFVFAPNDGGRLLVLLFLLAIAGAAVAALVLALRERHPHAAAAGPVGSPAPRTSDARRILDERYARGEIDDEEYQRRRSVLSAP